MNTTSRPEQELVKISVAGYTETDRMTTTFFDSNDTEFRLNNQAIHNLDEYLAEEREYILVSRSLAETLKAKKDIGFEEYEPD